MSANQEGTSSSNALPAEAAQKAIRSERLQRRWESEAPDQEWTRAASESLGDMIRSAGLEPGVVQNVSCRASVCRIELTFRDFAGVHKLVPVVSASAMSLEVVPAPSADPRAAAAQERPSEPRYLVYAARPGERIASLVDTTDDIQDEP